MEWFKSWNAVVKKGLLEVSHDRVLQVFIGQLALLMASAKLKSGLFLISSTYFGCNMIIGLVEPMS
jgi:hypothetical protein